MLESSWRQRIEESCFFNFLIIFVRVEELLRRDFGRFGNILVTFP